jgi:hypothetical protein
VRCALCALALAVTASSSAATASATIQIKPIVGKPTITPFTFKAVASGPSVLAPTARRGASVTIGRFDVASVAFTVQRVLPGRRQGKRCVKPTARNGRAKRCTRYIAVGGFRFSGQGLFGVVRFRFTGRVAGHKLKPGPYRLLGVPRNPTGLTGPPVFAAFSIA